MPDSNGVELYPEGGSWEIWSEGHTLHVIPHEEGTFQGTMVLRSGNLYAAKTVELNVAPLEPLDLDGEGFSFEKLTPNGDEDEETLRILNMFNASVDALEEAVQAYYESGNELAEGFGSLSEIMDALGTVEDGISFDDGNLAFSIRGDMEALSENREAGEVLTEGGVTQIEMVGSDSVYYILDDSGISISHTPLLSDDPDRGTGESVPRGRTRSGVTFIGKIQQCLDMLTSAINYIDMGMAAIENTLNLILKEAETNALGDMVAAVFEDTEAFQKAKQSYQVAKKNLKVFRAFKNYWSTLSISSSLLGISSDLRKLTQLVATEQHGHPLEEDYQSSEALETVYEMIPNIHRAYGFLTGDAFCNILSIVLSIEKVIDRATAIFPVTIGWRIAGAIIVAVVQIVTDAGGEICGSNADALYNTVMKQDDYLHDRNTISGQVTDRDTGEPLSGVSVICGSALVSTDETGHYEFITREDDLHITFRKEGYFEGTRDIRRSDTHMANMPLRRILGKLYGVVKDGDGNRLEGASVTAGGITVSTAATGVYTIWLKPGSYSVRFEKEGYESVTLTGVVEADRKENVSCVLEETGYGWISGTVRNPEGETIPNVTVRWEDTSVQTDENGYYRLRLPAGEQKLGFGRGGSPAYPRMDISAIILDRQEVTRNVVLQPELFYHLVIRDQNGVPMDNVEIQVQHYYDWNESYAVTKATTDENGEILIPVQGRKIWVYFKNGEYDVQNGQPLFRFIPIDYVTNPAISYEYEHGFDEEGPVLEDVVTVLNVTGKIAQLAKVTYDTAYGMTRTGSEEVDFYWNGQHAHAKVEESWRKAVFYIITDLTGTYQSVQGHVRLAVEYNGIPYVIEDDVDVTMSIYYNCTTSAVPIHLTKRLEK